MSPVVRQQGISGSQVFTWRRLMSQGALTAAAAGAEVVPAPDYRALEAQVRELQRLLDKKAMENELLREAVPGPPAQKTAVALNLVAGGRSVAVAADALGIARPHVSAMRNRPPPRPRGRPPLPDAELVADIRLLVADLPAYDYRRVHGLLVQLHESELRRSVDRYQQVQLALLGPHLGQIDVKIAMVYTLNCARTGLSPSTSGSRLTP